MSLRGRHDSKGQGKKSQREDSPKVLPPQESTLIAARLGQASITTPGHLEALADYSSELPIGDSSLNTSAHISPFEAIKRTGEHGNEFWRSREFASTLSYNDYTNFENVINKAKTACLNSGHLVEDHFRDVTEMIRIGKGQEILDYMGSAELAANLFRATQAEQKLRREGITGKANANRAHKEVGEKIRQTIKELGGTMPENLPTAESIKVLESRERKAIQFSREEDPGDKDPLKKP